MSPYRRNIMVGIVVLGAMITLAWMLIQFGGRFVSPFAPPTITVRFIADRADGLSTGSPVVYRGVNVGRVEKVSRAADQLRVFIDAAMDQEPPLPANMKAMIRATGLVGGSAAIILELTGDLPQGTLVKGQTVEAKFVGLDLVPPDVTELVAEMRGLVKQFRDSNLIAHLDEQVLKVGKLLDAIQTYTDDPKLRDDLKASLASIRATTAKADRIAGNLEKFSTDLPRLTGDASDAIVNLSKQTTARLEQASRLLDQFQSIAEKVNSGHGTAGALVNDRKLYESLVETAKELNATVLDLRRLMEQWEQEGVSLKLK